MLIARSPVVAAAAYVVCWVAGLAVWPTNLALDVPSATVAAAYASHGTQAGLQYLLVEGLAGVLLVLAVGRREPASASRGRTATTRRAAVVAAGTVSVLQCGLGAGLILVAARHPATAGTLFDAVNRLDGGKMLLLALAAAALAATSGPGWLRVLSGALAVTLLTSGVSCLLLVAGAGWTVYLSGPLLLVWVPVTAVRAARTTGRSSGRPSPASTSPQPVTTVP